MIYRWTSIAESQRDQPLRLEQVCYNSFLAVAAELHRDDSVCVAVKPCSSVKRSNSATQFGVFRIG